MRYDDMQQWLRRDHFEFFNTFNHPHFNMCANVDISNLHTYSKERGVSSTVAILYVISRAANAIPEFRYRMLDGNVVEYETVSPSFTILVKADLFGFCFIDYNPEFTAFAARAANAIAEARDNPTLKDPPDRQDLLYMTAIPWVSFTSFTHPMRLHPSDYIPRFAWGKYYQDGGNLKMPLSVQGHHALMDGIHIGRYYGVIQEYLDDPGTILEGV
jgi:chloramphenicol O-acetyltransferase type A